MISKINAAVANGGETTSKASVTTQHRQMAHGENDASAYQWHSKQKRRHNGNSSAISGALSSWPWHMQCIFAGASVAAASIVIMAHHQKAASSASSIERHHAHRAAQSNQAAHGGKQTINGRNGGNGSSMYHQHLSVWRQRGAHVSCGGVVNFKAAYGVTAACRIMAAWRKHRNA